MLGFDFNSSAKNANGLMAKRRSTPRSGGLVPFPWWARSGRPSLLSWTKICVAVWWRQFDRWQSPRCRSALSRKRRRIFAPGPVWSLWMCSQDRNCTMAKLSQCGGTNIDAKWRSIPVWRRNLNPCACLRALRNVTLPRGKLIQQQPEKGRFEQGAVLLLAIRLHALFVASEMIVQW